MNLGKIIQFYRKECALTQSELAEGICSQGEISLIEKGERIPSFELIVKISKKLAIPIDSFLNEQFETEIELLLNTIFEQLEVAVKNRAYASMANYVLDDFMWNHCITPHDKQQFLCYKGIYITFYEKKPKKALAIYQQALQETITILSIDPIIISKKKVYSKTETFLLSATATCYFLIKKYHDAERLFDLACKNIELIQAQTSIETLGTIYYNASKNLKCLKKYLAAIDIAKTGVNFEQKKNAVYRSSELLFEIGESYYKLQNISVAEKYYIKSLYLAFSTDNHHFLSLLIPALEKKSELELLQQAITCVQYTL